MKNLTLLFVCILMVLLLKERPSAKAGQLQRIEVNQVYTTDVPSVLFLPRSLQFDELVVNGQIMGVVFLHVGRDIYVYRRKYSALNTYYLETEAHEVPLSSRTKIKLDFKKSNIKTAPVVKLMMFRELNV